MFHVSATKVYDAGTTHLLPLLTIAATDAPARYVIERYQASSKHNVM